MEILNKIITNPLFGILGFSFSFISIIIAIIFYFKSRKLKEVMYSIQINKLFDDSTRKIPQLQVFFNNKVINRLTASKLALWNSGTTTISKSDIAKASPLQLKLKKDFEILDIKNIYSSHSGNNVKCLFEKSGNSIKISFDYLDRKEGAVIQILHTSDNPEPLEMEGHLIGTCLKKFKSSYDFDEPKSFRLIKLIGLLIISLWTILISFINISNIKIFIPYIVLSGYFWFKFFKRLEEQTRLTHPDFKMFYKNH